MYFEAATPKVNQFEVDPSEVTAIVKVLNSQGIVCYPTDTIWGIGCDATDSMAIIRVNRLKERPAAKDGYVLLVADIEMLRNYVEEIDPHVETLLSFHQRPVTIIYEQGKNLPAEVCAADGSVAIRIPRDEFCVKVIKELGKPIISTSANISDTPFPEYFGEISSEVLQGVDYVAKHRRWDRSVAQPSTIARMGTKGELDFLR